MPSTCCEKRCSGRSWPPKCGVTWGALPPRRRRSWTPSRCGAAGTATPQRRRRRHARRRWPPRCRCCAQRRRFRGRHLQLMTSNTCCGCQSCCVACFLGWPTQRLSAPSTPKSPGTPAPSLFRLGPLFICAPRGPSRRRARAPIVLTQAQQRQPPTTWPCRPQPCRWHLGSATSCGRRGWPPTPRL